MDEDVALGVGGADLYEFDRPAADLHVEPAIERARRKRQRDALEPERSEDPAEEVAGLAGRVRETGQQTRRYMRHLLGRRRRRDDLRPAAQFVAVAMLAVGMGVDDGADRSRRRRVAHVL